MTLTVASLMRTTSPFFNFGKVLGLEFRKLTLSQSPSSQASAFIEGIEVSSSLTVVLHPPTGDIGCAQVSTII